MSTGRPIVLIMPWSMNDLGESEKPPAGEAEGS